LALAVEHFTLRDIAGIFAGMFAFLPFLFGPGYVVGYVLNLFRFRQACWRERFASSVVLSFSITPICGALLARVSSLAVVCAVCLAITVAAFVLILYELRNRPTAPRQSLDRDSKTVLWLLFAWMLIAIASLVDLQHGTRLFLPEPAFDQSVRSALTGGVLRSGVPPANPFFYPGHPIPMRYYYYWNLVCALAAKLFRLAPRYAALSGILWAGLALACLITLYLKHFCEETVDLSRKAWIGITLLAVTGLDIIPTIMVFIAQHEFYGDMEWWDSAQVTSWIDSLLWVPHHVAGLISCCTGFLVLWVVPRDAPARERVIAAIVAALAFSSAAGLSVYVTFTFAIFLITWTLVLARWSLWKEVLTFTACGILTVIISLPYLHDLRQPGWSGDFATFYVRTLESIGDWADAHIEADWLQNLFLVALLPVYYLIEFGAFAVAGFATWKAYWRRNEPLRKWEWAALNIFSASLLVGTFLESTTGNNDLGYRSILFAQFVLLLWTVPYIYRWYTERSSRNAKPSLLFRTFLVLGIASTVFQLVELRIYTVLADHHAYVDAVNWLPDTDTIALDIYSIRSAVEQLNRHLPQDALVQFSPAELPYEPNVYYLQRSSVEGIPNCGTAFGGDPFACQPFQHKLLDAFNGRKPYGLEQADQLCKDLHIDVLVAERSDRMWAIKQSWVWRGTPAVQNEYVRAIPCGARREQIASAFPKATAVP
jgi:hypothetical protein